MKKYIISKSIWIVFAIVMFIIGYVNYKSSENADMGAYFTFGLICSIPIIGFAFRLIRYATNTGKESGSQEITITQTSSYTYSVHDNSGWGSLIGFFIGVVVSLAIGPFALPIIIVINIVQLTTVIIKIVRP